MKKLIATLLRTLAEPAAPPEPDGHSELLDYAERESVRALNELRAAFDAHFDRAIKVLTLLTGGAGAVLAYTVNNLQTLGYPGLWSLLLLGGGWGATAAFLAAWGMRSHRIDGGADLQEMGKTYAEHGGGTAPPQSAETAAQALLVLRREELSRRHLKAKAYAKAVGVQTKEIRRAVIFAAAWPVLSVALLVVATLVEKAG